MCESCPSITTTTTTTSSVDCKTYQVTAYAANAGATYTDCNGSPQTVNLGGPGQPTSAEFCAIDLTVFGFGEVGISILGPCLQ